MASSSSSQSSKPSVSNSSSPSPAHSNGEARLGSARSGFTIRENSATSVSNSSPLRWDRQTIQFSIGTWVLIVLAISVLPLIPRNVSTRAYRLSLLGTVCSSLYSLCALYGGPRSWKLPALQIYLQSIIGTKDFISVVYCLIFLTSSLCLRFALISILCRDMETVSKFLRHNFSCSTLYRKYLEDLCVWVESNITTLSILSSHAEICLGFLLIISLFSWQRNIVQTIMYWQLLKHMYRAPVTRGYHRSAWATIGRNINPFLNRYFPFFKTPIDVAQRWWVR